MTVMTPSAALRMLVAACSLSLMEAWPTTSLAPDADNCPAISDGVNLGTNHRSVLLRLAIQRPVSFLPRVDWCNGNAKVEAA